MADVSLELDFDSLARVLGDRFSCRAFLPNEVADDTLDRIFALAQQTPSWCNVQPWEVVLLSGDATKTLSDVLFAAAEEGGDRYDVDPPAAYTGIYKERRRESGFALYGSLGIARDDFDARTRQGAENLRFFGAPHVAILTSELELGAYGLVDCGAYLSTLLLAATSLGIGTIAQAAVAHFSLAIRDHLGIPASRQVVCAIAFGYSDARHPANGFRTSRAPIGDVIRKVNS